MSPQHDRPRVLSVQQSFVVQFATDTQMDVGQIVGRAEHVVSGQAVHFESLGVLMAFFDRVLSERRNQ